MHCKPISQPPLNHFITIALAICLLLAWSSTKAFAEISDEQARAIADKAIAKFHVRAPYWTSQLDKNLEDWHKTRASWEKWFSTQGKNRTADTKARIDEIESAIKGKEVWLVVYRAVVPAGQKAFHTHAIVFLNVKTGDVLDIIHQEE